MKYIGMIIFVLTAIGLDVLLVMATEPHDAMLLGMVWGNVINCIALFTAVQLSNKIKEVTA